MKKTITIIIDTESNTETEVFEFEGDEMPQELKDFIKTKIGE